MFVDRVEFEVSSGKGGAGAVSFRREKFVPKGGPDGGDGGKGGDIYFFTADNCDTLSHFRGKNKMGAKNGEPGGGRNKHGKNGEDLVLTVPTGTQVIDSQSGEVLLDLMETNQKVLFLKGGKGGLGNTHFKNPANQRPMYAQPGLPAEVKNIRLELKLIADVGLAGFPNVGKSTLISVLSNAKPEIADYEFTTLIPNLGVVDIDEEAAFVVADIPGIIEGASEGRGLGLEFLRHIERTAVVLFVIDVSNYRDTKTQYEKLKNELNRYSEELHSKPFAIALTKCDQFESEGVDRAFKEFSSMFKKVSEKPEFILPISSVSGLNITELKQRLYRFVKEIKSQKSDKSEKTCGE